MPGPKAKVSHYEDTPGESFGDEAPGVTIRWVIDEKKDGAPHFALRVIEVEPGCSSPEHTHPFEHENFVLEGRGRVLMGDEWYDLRPGFVAFLPAGIKHCFSNTGNTPLKFLCGIPVSTLIPDA